MNTVSQPAKAPAVMMPSMPRLSTPARSQMSSPRVAKMSGEAMRTAAAQSEAVEQDFECVHGQRQRMR